MHTHGLAHPHMSASKRAHLASSLFLLKHPLLAAPAAAQVPELSEK